MSSNVFNPRKPLFWLASLALAAALFASGALVARATLDESRPVQPSDGDRSQVVLPGIATGEGASPVAPAGYGKDDVMPASGRGAAPASMPACRAPLPAGLVANGNIDWSKASFAPALPSAGFSALSFSLGSNGACEKDGTAASGGLTLSTSWRHDETGLEAHVTQTASSERVASVLRGDSATFWAAGYRFDVGVNSYLIMRGGVAEDMPAIAPASGSGSATAGARPSMSPSAPGGDPRAAEVLRQLIGQISPASELKCFWTTAPGDWGSLALVGAGDPRPAIPAGFSELDLNVTTFNPPAPGCDTSVKPVEGFSLNASWQKGNTAYLGISVYSSGYMENYPGNITEYGANWARSGLQFGVYAKAEAPLGIETIRAIARALDPQFDEACFVRQRTLTEAELPALGISPAKAPDGFAVQSSHLSATEVAAGCPRPEGFESSYTANWTFAGGADFIEAGANAYGGAPAGNGSGYRGQNSLNWTSAKGVTFYVNGSSRGISPTVSEETLVAIAKSMDPSFDLSKLQDGGEKPMPPMPASPERSARP